MRYDDTMKQHPTTQPSDTISTASPLGWKSYLVYLAACLSAIDALIQGFVVHDIWSAVVSSILTLFLAAESFGRIRAHKTYLGQLFAPVFSTILILLFVVTYGLGWFTA